MTVLATPLFEEEGTDDTTFFAIGRLIELEAVLGSL
jgi:hypothetical protein